MKDVANKSAASLRPSQYWWLWLVDTVLVTAGAFFFLATRYGTHEFLGQALLMALLPLIPVMVLVGGAGSTVFALTKVLIEKRTLPRPTALALLVGPALVVTAALGLLGAFKSPVHRLSYICAGRAPASAGEVRLAGYSSFLREEWLAVFRLDEKSFQTLVIDAKLTPADEFEFNKVFDASALKSTQPGQSVLPLTNTLCFKRVFKPDTEHERGTVFALFDSATSTVVVLRGYRD